MDSNNYTFYLTLVITFVVLILSYLIAKRVLYIKKCCLLTGLSESGKTALFTKLVYSIQKKTVTSLIDNIGEIEDLNIKIVDLPGADRLREPSWQQNKHKATEVVFVIDSLTIEEKLREVSEYLYTLLSDSIVHKNKTKFVIACNKQDLEGAKKKQFIRASLERELEAIKATKKGQLGKISQTENDEDYLSKVELKLDKLNIDIIETSCQEKTSELRSKLLA